MTVDHMVPATPSLMGIPVEIRRIKLQYLLCSKSQLSHQPEHLQQMIFAQQAGSLKQGSFHFEAESNSCAPIEAGQSRICDIYRSTNTHRRAAKARLRCEALHPIILRVCRQLLMEGDQLQYTGKFINITYLKHPGVDLHSSYVSDLADLHSTLRKYPRLKEIKDWHVSICIEAHTRSRCHGCLSLQECNKIVEDAQALSKVASIERFTILHCSVGVGSANHNSECMKSLLDSWQGASSKDCRTQIPPEHIHLAAQLRHQITSNFLTADPVSYVHQPQRLLDHVLQLSKGHCNVCGRPEIRCTHPPRSSKYSRVPSAFGENMYLRFLMCHQNRSDRHWNAHEAKKFAARTLLRVSTYMTSTAEYLIRRLNGSQVCQSVSIGRWMRLIRKRQYQLKLMYKGQRRLKSIAKLLHID